MEEVPGQLYVWHDDSYSSLSVIVRRVVAKYIEKYNITEGRHLPRICYIRPPSVKSSNFPKRVSIQFNGREYFVAVAFDADLKENHFRLF